MTPFVIRPHISESTFSFAIALNGVAVEQETPSVTGEIYWRWEDEPTARPQYAGSVVAGHSFRFPLETKGRDVHWYLVSVTSDGQKSVSRIEQAEQVVFSSPARVFSGEFALEAGEDLLPFDLVHIYDDAGTSKVRKADATNETKPARAFVIEAAAGGLSLGVGEQVRLFFGGNLITIAGKTWTPGGPLYLSESAGEIDTAPPTGTGKIVQVIGTALTEETAIFEPDEPIVLE